MDASAGRDGPHSLRVVGRRRESRTITSFELEPLQGKDWRPFEPGQFLTFRIPDGDGGQGQIRTYSISSAPGLTGRYRITVKREGTPGPGLPDGIGSCFLHDRIGLGDIVEALAPRGAFVLDRESRRPVVLLSGGVGLTPLVSMLHGLSAESGRRVYFIHACDDGEVHALREEVDATASSRPGITVRYLYRAPTGQDRAEGRFHAEGLLTRERLREWLPLDDYDFYLCGPPPFMKAVYAALRSLGVPKHRIAYEFFGPATVLEEEVTVAAPRLTAPETTAVPAANGSAGTAEGRRISFSRSGVVAYWDDRADSLLSFAEGLGLKPEFSCRAGICSTCRTGLLEGEVDYLEEPLDPPGPDQLLLCCTRPRGNLVLDL